MAIDRDLGWKRAWVGAAAALTVLAGCGGGTTSPPPNASAGNPAASSGSGAASAQESASLVPKLSGSVAVGAPITDGSLRVVDADGTVVAENVALDADGRYRDVTLTGRAPWRLEGCGYAGSTWMCLESVVQAAGTGNVTPLTDAMLRLGGTSGAGAVQSTLRTSLAGLLSDAGLDGTFDFVTGDLAAGSRTGYDRLLDAIGVIGGQDGKPFVQITPRLGSGNLYLEQGAAPVGAVNVASGAASLSLAGLEALFRRMSAAMASAEACASPTIGIRRSLASNARIGMDDGEPLTGADAVAQGLCRMFAGGGGQPSMWGSRLTSPVLGRCDLGGEAPVCRVSFVLRSPAGGLERVGQNLAVTQEAGEWRFMGDALPIQINASANVQRDRRIDGPTPLDEYSRALSFEVAARTGLECAKVSQRNAGGAEVLLAFYKRHAGAASQPRLSLWTQDAMSNTRSLDPATGTTRATDDSWILLPEGTEGDTVIRNFYRGGRSVLVDLYADAACSTPFAVGGRSRFEVDVEGVPPVWTAMDSMPWPELTAASVTALRDLAIPAMSTSTLSMSWTLPRGAVALSEATACSERACGDGSAGRIGTGRMPAGSTTVSVPVSSGATALAAGGFRMLALYGGLRDGTRLQANFLSCPSRPAGQRCQQ